MNLRSSIQRANRRNSAGTTTFSRVAEVVECADERELKELMVRYQAADSAAVEELVNRLSPRLLRFLTESGVTRSGAEDLLQDCWLRIHRSRHTYRSSEPLLPWVFGIARHIRLDGYRKRRRLESREVLVGSYEESIHPTESGAATDQNEFLRLVGSLPQSQREVLQMMKVTEMSVEEVARATSSTVGAVKQKAHRAYATLRLLLREK